MSSFREDNSARWFGVRPAHKGEQILETSSASGGASTIYTVPANKVFLLCNATAMYYGTGTGSNIYMVIYDNGGSQRYRIIHRWVTAQNNSYQSSANYYPPIELSAGYYIVIGTGLATYSCFGSIHGFLESA